MPGRPTHLNRGCVRHCRERKRIRSRPRATHGGDWRTVYSKSPAPTPHTGSLNVTVTSSIACTVAPAAGLISATVGGTRSARVYCHDAPGAKLSNGRGVGSKSAIPCAPLQEIKTVPSGGGAKPKVKLVPPPMSVVAGLPLMSKSDACTPLTNSLKLMVICVRFVTLPGGGMMLAITGGAEMPTVTLTTLEVPRPPRLSVATA